jgi:hypothetical protein
MRNVHDPADQAGVGRQRRDLSFEGTPEKQRPWQQRRYQVATAVTTAAALGAGLFIANHVGHGRARDASVARAAVATPGTPTALPGMAVGSTAPGSAPATGAPAKAAPAKSPPAKAAQPPAMQSTTTTTTTGDVTVTSSGSLPKEHHTLRVVSARSDLSGQRELAWAADAGRVVGDARCTQNFRFNAASRAGVRPTLMICWRTSATKSVYTVAVDIDHRPSAQASVAIIDRIWSKLR